MSEWGIKNYQPKWTNSTQVLLTQLREEVISGHTVQSLWSLWDMEDDEWFKDAPVILCADKKQFEFCANRLANFSFSTDSIDLSQPVYWCGEKEDLDLQPLRWVRQKNTEFDGLVGKTITGVEVIEARVSDTLQTYVGLEPWILSGIVLRFQSERLEIFNGLDCNCLSREKKDYETQGVRYLQH